MIIEQGSSETPSVSLSCQQGEAGQMERSLPFVCLAVRCGLTAVRYPLSVEMVFPNEVIDFRLSDFRLWTE